MNVTPPPARGAPATSFQVPYQRGRYRAFSLNGQTLSQISRETGLSLSYVSRIFRGQRSPSMTTIQRLARQLHVTETALIRALTAIR